MCDSPYSDTIVFVNVSVSAQITFAAETFQSPVNKTRGQMYQPADLWPEAINQTCMLLFSVTHVHKPHSVPQFEWMWTYS